VERVARDRLAAVAGMLSVLVFVVGQYVAPAPVYPVEQVGGLEASFYANYQGRLLAEAILFGVASALFWSSLVGCERCWRRRSGSSRGWPRSWSLPGPWRLGWYCSRQLS
jgi:hypothetical protein